MDITRSQQSSGVRMTRHARVVGVVLLLVGSLVGAAAVGGAQSNVAETNVTTSYDGTGGGSQAVSVEFTLTAQTQLTGLRVEVAPTQRSFVAYGSIEPSASGEGVSIGNPSRGVYEVDQLEQGQSVTLAFDAYPRRLDQERLAVSVVSLSAENPNTYDDSVTVRADLSSSPLLAYQEAQSELENTETLGTATLAGIVFALLVAVAGLGAAFYFYRKRDERVAATYASVVDDLEGFRANIPSDSEYAPLRNRLDSIIDDYRGESGPVGDPGPGGEDPDEPDRPEI